MGRSNRGLEKLFQNRIDRKSKTFVDKDLQMQIPGYDFSVSVAEEKHNYNPIYSHYANPHSDHSPLSPGINAEEIEQAMDDAKHSYQAWKKMRDHLGRTVN